MRITQGIMTGHLIRNLSRTLREIDQLEQQVTSGKKVTKPSDDPIAMDDSLRLRSGLAEIEQFLKNAESATSWVNLTESALQDTIKVIHRVKEIATEGANGTQTSESREAAAKEVDQLAGELVQLANSSLSGRYIFAGSKTAQPPYVAATDMWKGDDRSVNFGIGPGITIDVNTIGSDVFTGTGTARSLFALLKDVAQNLRDDDTSALGGARLQELEEALDNTLDYNAEIGAKMNRMEMAQKRLLEAEQNFTEILSKTEDIDMAKTLINLTSYESAYENALAAGAKIIQPSLVDFIK